MEDLNTTLPAGNAGDFELGIMLGTRQAFAAAAGRCSAADAECIRRIREGKLYLSRAATWEDFCPEFLGLSKTHANRLIRYLEEFGPDYFEITQWTRITPEQYRAIAPAIRESNIHVNGEAIALIPENSGKIAAAVADLRQAAAPAGDAPDSIDERMAALEQRLDRLLADFRELARSPMTPAESTHIELALLKAAIAFQELELNGHRIPPEIG